MIRVHIERVSRTPVKQRRRHSRRLAMLGVCATIVGVALPVSADTTGTVVMTVTVNVLGVATPPAPAGPTVLTVRSITVSPSIAAYSSCTNPTGATLTVPGGECTSPTGAATAVTIKNGALPSKIQVSGTDFKPMVDPGTDKWTLGNAQGENIAMVTTKNLSGATGTTTVLAADTCDLAFSASSSGGSCDAIANGSAQEVLTLKAPTLSTSKADAWSHSVTWTAFAP